MIINSKDYYQKFNYLLNSDSFKLKLSDPTSIKHHLIDNPGRNYLLEKSFLSIPYHLCTQACKRSEIL